MDNVHSFVKQSVNEKEKYWLVKAFEDKINNTDLTKMMAISDSLNISTPNISEETHFQAINKLKLGKLKKEEFAFIRKVFSRPGELHDLFKEYSCDGINIASLDLLDFIIVEQFETNVDRSTALRIINYCEPITEGREKTMLTYDGFVKFMTSPDCCIFNQAHNKIYQRMDLPLVNYFIASSHNTFFMNDQLIGWSNLHGYIRIFLSHEGQENRMNSAEYVSNLLTDGVEGFYTALSVMMDGVCINEELTVQRLGTSSRALKKGCRCLEIVCCDGPENEPMVYHGLATSSQILFKDVINVVNLYAFEASDYPLILSLEVHCNPVQQHSVADYLGNILGNRLFTLSSTGNLPSKLPSPKELKRKIIIRSKKVGSILETFRRNGEIQEREIGEYIEELDPEEEIPGREASSRTSSFRPKKKKLKERKIRIAMKLSDLIIYSKCVQFKSLKHSMEHQEFYESNSFSEQRVLKLIKQSVCELVQHNSRFLSRTYPSGNRRGISNYKPHEFWNVGCQMVALNYQSPGLCMDLNNGRFLTNGRCGYVLKPEFMNNDTKFNPFNPQHKRDPVTLIIQIIRGEHIPISKTCSKITVDPYVQVQIYGLPKDNAKQQSKSLHSQGNNPKWNDIFTFSIQVPELALVRFTVRDSNLFSKNEFLGQYTLPFTSMKKGYRFVPLLSFDGLSLSPAKLFVYVWYA